MPSHKIHLGIAQEVNKKLNLDNDYYIEHQEFLDKLYKGCINYIKDNIINYI